VDHYGDYPANAPSPNCRNPTTAASSSLTRSRTRSPRLRCGQTVPERHRRKLPRLVSSGLVWTPYLFYIVGVYPPFPALIETGGKTDTQSAAHARCVPGKRYKAHAIF